MRCIVGGILVLSGVSPKEEEKIPLAIYRYNPGIIPTAGLIFERGFFNYTAGPSSSPQQKMKNISMQSLSRLKLVAGQLLLKFSFLRAAQLARKR
jgi:hypothetical protein